MTEKEKHFVEGLCETARFVERYAGQCVVLSRSAKARKKVANVVPLSAESFPGFETPFVFHVPSRQELSGPFAVGRQRP